MPKPAWQLLGVGLAMLTAILLPLNLLANQRFHHDEALYASWALQIASGENLWLAQTPIDKPPLFLYTTAASMRFLGTTETAARLPSLLATVFIVALTFRLGQKVFSDAVGLLAAWLVALSPFIVMFAPTALTDPMLVALILAACLAAAGGRPILAGVWLGLAAATKQQAIFFIPLTMMFLSLSPNFGLAKGRREQRTTFGTNTVQIPPSDPPQEEEKNGFWEPLNGYILAQGLLLLTAGLAFLPALIWDGMRGQTPGFWRLSLTNYGGLAAATVSWTERWWEFFELLQYGTASFILNLIFGLGLPLLLIWDAGEILKVRAGGTLSQCSPHLMSGADTPDALGVQNAFWTPKALDRLSWSAAQMALVDGGLALFCAIFLLGHVLLSFQVWDRYLLGLIPILALLLARILWLPWFVFRQYWFDQPSPVWSIARLMWTFLIIWLLAAILPQPIQDAVNARYPLGSNSAGLSGLKHITAYLQGQAGANHTLYHRWLGTHWKFYLWDYPYDLQYWESPQALANRAEAGHLIAFPSWRSETEARIALAEAGLRLIELSQAYGPAGNRSITLYRVEER